MPFDIHHARQRLSFRTLTIRRKGAAIAALLGMAAAPLAACGSEDNTGHMKEGVGADTILLGATSTMSGPLGSRSTPVTNAAKAWFDHVNASGGINGRKIEYEILDDKYTAPAALANTRKLIERDVFTIFGGVGSVQVPAVYPEAHKAGIPVLFRYAAVAEFANVPGNYSLIPLYGDQLQSMIKAVFRKYGTGSVVFFATQIPGIEEVEAGVKKATQEAGGTNKGGFIVPSDVNDLNPTILKIKDGNPDYLLIASTAAIAANVVNKARAQGFVVKKKIIGPSQLTQGQFYTSLSPEDQEWTLLGSVVAAPSPYGYPND